MIQAEPPIGTSFFSLTNDVANQPPLLIGGYPRSGMLLSGTHIVDGKFTVAIMG